MPRVSNHEAVIRDDGSAERENALAATGRDRYRANSLARSGQIFLRAQADLGCPVPFAKIFPFRLCPNQIYINRVPPPLRGVSRSSRT